MRAPTSSPSLLPAMIVGWFWTASSSLLLVLLPSPSYSLSVRPVAFRRHPVVPCGRSSISYASSRGIRRRAVGGAMSTSRTTSTSTSTSLDGDGANAGIPPPIPPPQVFATGYSTSSNLEDAIHEATDMALSCLPPPPPPHDGDGNVDTTSRDINMIDVAIVVASSLYDEPSRIVPLLLGAVKHLGAKGEGGGRRCYDGVRHVVGNTAGGVIGSIVRDGSGGEDGSGGTLACDARESEGAPALSVTFALLPDVEIRTFRLAGGRDCNAPSFDPRPDGIEGWRRDVGLGGFARDDDDDDIDERDARDANEDGDGGGPIFMVVPSPAYQNDIDEFMYGLRCAFPHGKIFGGIASTVSSLSRARVFAYSEKEAASIGGVGRGGGITSSISYSYTSSSIPEHSSYGDGCVGLAMYGDVRVDTMIAQGAKPVGGVYRVVATGRGGRSSSTKTGSRSSRSSPRSRSSSMSRGDDYDEEEGSDNDDDQASRSTIGAIVLDEAATVEESEAEEGGYDNDDKDDDDGSMNVDNDDGGDGMSEMEKRAAKRTRLMADYAKARIPKPPLAEANFVMKKLSDDDQAFMRRALLIGLERGGNGVGRTPGELARLARGEGHRFTVRQVASAGMKDGSVTFPLGSVNVKVGARCRFFVRDGEFARKEVEALWTGYKKKELEGTLMGGEDALGPPTACLVLPTLDRGAKLFGGKAGYESNMASRYLPSTSSIFGFFACGVLGDLGTVATGTGGGGVNDNMLHGSSSQYVVFRSKTKRPFYSPELAKAEAANVAAIKAEEEAVSRELAAEDERRSLASKKFAPDSGERSEAMGGRGAPRSENGELVVRRREIHSGRALSVSTVEWSVAEKTARPTSALEGYMWEKETQVDRLRERVPLAQLMTNTKAAMINPMSPKPRDWIGSVKKASADGKFVIIPECKRMEPVSGSLRKRYDISKLVKQLTEAGASAISVNSDGVLFGGSMDDITRAREASDAAAVAESLNSSDGDGVVAPPVLASDLLLYPYQLYKLRLAGADAVTLLVGALEGKDLLYLTKIASTVQLQVVASVTSEHQIAMVNKLGAGSVVALIVSNRDLETFGFDDSGEQALKLLRSEELALFREKNGDNVPILVEGRVGIVGAGDGDGAAYVRALKDAGAFGAIVGGGIAMVKDEDLADSLVGWSL